MKFTLDNYKKFYYILNKISDITNDIQIINSKICQRTSDKKSGIYVDFSPIMPNFEDMEINLYNVKNKLSLFKVFKDATNDYVSFELDGSNYIMSDGVSELKIRYANMKEFGTKYDESLYRPYIEDNKIIDFSMNKAMLKKLIGSINSLDSEGLTLTFDEASKTGSLSLSNISKTSSMVLLKDIPCNTSYTSVTINPDCFTSGSIGDEVSVFVYTTDIPNKVIVSLKTELEGCSVEYTQGRKAYS